MDDKSPSPEELKSAFAAHAQEYSALRIGLLEWPESSSHGEPYDWDAVEMSALYVTRQKHPGSYHRFMGKDNLRDHVLTIADGFAPHVGFDGRPELLARQRLLEPALARQIEQMRPSSEGRLPLKNSKEDNADLIEVEPGVFFDKGVVEVEPGRFFPADVFTADRRRLCLSFLNHGNGALQLIETASMAGRLFAPTIWPEMDRNAFSNPLVMCLIWLHYLLCRRECGCTGFPMDESTLLVYDDLILRSFKFDPFTVSSSFLDHLIKDGVDSHNYSPKENVILEAIGSDCLLGREIADRSGYPFNSALRDMLGALKRRRILEVGPEGRGYRIR